MTQLDWPGGHLTELDDEECQELLTTRSVGRVAYNLDGGPVVLPVNYTTYDGCVLFRTAPGRPLAEHVDGQPVSFEVDDVDDFTRSGWSVLLRGGAEVLAAEADLPDAAVPSPWPDGARSLLVRVRPRSVTGRRLLPS
jgi:uncharacterized protein